MRIFWFTVCTFFLFGQTFAQTPEIVRIFNAEIERANVADDWVEIIWRQMEQESAFRPEARSRYAGGLMQFTPPTQGDWYPRTRPSCKDVDILDPTCSIRAGIRYDKWHYKRFSYADTFVDRWGFSLAAYNGGAGWVDRERLRCKLVIGCDADKYFDHVQSQCGKSASKRRSAASCRENTRYPERILGRAGLR